MFVKGGVAPPDAHLAAPVLGVNVAGHGEAAVQDLLGVIHRGLQKVPEVLIFRHLLVPCLAPLRHRLAGDRKHTEI